MKRFALLLLIPLLLLGGYYILYPMYQVYSLINYKQHTYDWNQKLTLRIDTPNGPIDASSITHMGVDYFPGGLPLSGKERSYHLTGEAVVADLGDGRYLFALLPKSELAERSFWDLHSSDDPRGVLLRSIQKQVGQPARPVPLKYYPLLVTFGEVSDPASVMRVDPADLALSFGAGFALREITLEVTDDAVTKGVVEGVLGWLSEVGKAQANLIGKPEVGLVSDQPDPRLYMISVLDFSTELFK
ncbi:MAG: hypothetical protein L3J30_03225 [Marinosulfonomonas sp.]|nr:hypothetical protein [Marinosulfonomonas sp.]